jgi:hypothetical protein
MQSHVFYLALRNPCLHCNARIETLFLKIISKLDRIFIILVLFTLHAKNIFFNIRDVVAVTFYANMLHQFINRGPHSS